MILEPDEDEDPTTALAAIMFDLQAAARLAEGIAQQTDMFAPVLINTCRGISQALKGDADRLGRIILPRLQLQAVAKDGEDEHASTAPITTPPPTETP